MSGDPLDMRGPRPKAANQSELMRAKGSARAGRRVNFCPYGCQDHELDDFDYCRHLVGFTVPGDPKRFEFMPPAEDGRPGEIKRRSVAGRDVREVRRTDKLVRITNCYRVYRDVDAERPRKPDPATTQTA